MVADTLATVGRLRARPPNRRGDGVRRRSCCCGRLGVLRTSHQWRAAIRGGAEVSVTVRLDPNGQSRDRRHRRRCLDAHRVHRRRLRREHRQMDLAGRGRRDRVHRVHLPTKASQQVRGRLVVRRIPDLNRRGDHGQGTCSTPGGSTRSSPPPTCDTVTADKTHREHAIIEQVHADLKDSALAHLPSGRFIARTPHGWSGGDGVQPA